MTIRNADLIGAVASLVAAEIANEGKLGVGHGNEHAVIHITHEEDREWAILRTDNGGAWVMRVAPLGKGVQFDGSSDAAKVRYSHGKYKELLDDLARVQKAAKAMGIEDEDLVVQSWHDEVLNDAEREHWGRWVSGGYASDAEWRIATGSPRPVPTTEMPRDDEIDEMRV